MTYREWACLALLAAFLAAEAQAHAPDRIRELEERVKVLERRCIQLDTWSDRRRFKRWFRDLRD